MVMSGRHWCQRFDMVVYCFVRTFAYRVDFYDMEVKRMDVESCLQDYMQNPKWNGKLFMQDEKTCYKDGFQDGVNSIDSQVKSLKKENKKLQKLLLQQQQLVRDLKCCGNCDRKENRGLCGYEEKCYSYIYIHQYLRPFFCDPVDLKEIEGYKDYWKPISLTGYDK